MSDFKIDLEDQEHDLLFTTPDFEIEDGLRSAVFISLFTDRRAEVEETENGEDPRGNWSDHFENTPLGSKLWLLFKRKQNEETRVLSEEYSKQALQWLLLENVAERIEVAASFPESGILYLEVKIFRPGGEEVSFEFSTNWNAEQENE